MASAAEIPIPSVAEVGQGIGYISQNSNQSTVAVLTIVCLALGIAVVFLFLSCRKEMAGAWARVTQISEARTSDAQNMIKSIGDNTNALNRVADNVLDRRSVPR